MTTASSTTTSPNKPRTSQQQQQQQQQQRPSTMDLLCQSQAENMPLMSQTRGIQEWILSCFGTTSTKATKPKAVVGMFKLLTRFSTTQEKVYMIVGLVCATFAGLGIPVWLTLLASALDTFSNLGKLLAAGAGDGVMDLLQQKLVQLSVAFMIVGAIVFVSGTLYVGIWTYTGQQQTLRLEKQFVNRALHQDAAFFDAHDREALPTEMGTNILHVSAALGRAIPDVFGLFVSAMGCLVVALLLNSALSLIMLAAIPVVAIVMWIFTSCFISKYNQLANVQLAMAGSIATEVISGIKTVAALCAKVHFRERYAHHLHQSEHAAIQSGVLQASLAGIVAMSFYFVYCYAFYVGTEQVVNNTGLLAFLKCFFNNDPNDPECSVTGASVMCCIYGVILSVTFIGLMVPPWTAIQIGRQAAVAVFEVIERTPIIDSSSDVGMKLPDIQGTLQFRNITFAYPSKPERVIFYDFNLTVEAGQSVALVGPSGSGKSTIARFLLRFYDPNQGQVLIDGVPLTELNVAWLRDKIGYVEQEPRLFPGTIRENIALGVSNGTNKDTVSNEEIVEAAKAACAHDFITELPDGYDTYYAGTGVQLSGGQMQRIAIARAIIRKPVLLVLDEATSALDSASEKHVTEALANVRRLRKMTTVTIAHRLSTIVDSDLIAVLDKGKVQELGNHRTLYEKDGIYTLLCTTQGIDANFSSSISEPSKEVQQDNANDKTGDVEEGMERPSDGKEVNGDTKGSDLVEVEMTPMSTIWSFLGMKDCMYAVLGVAGSVIVGALSPCEAILTANIVNNFYTVDRDEMLEVNLTYILPFAYAFATAALFGNIMVGLGLSRSGNRLGNQFRNLAFASMLKRSMGWFDDPDRTVGELTTLLGADAESTMRLTGWQLGNRVRVMSSLCTGIVIAFIFSWQIGVTALACVPLIMLASVVQAVVLQRKYVASETNVLTPPTILETGLRGITSVQAYNLESKVSCDYDASLSLEAESKASSAALTGLVYGFTQSVIFVSFGIIFYVGAQLLIDVKINFLQFFAALLSVMFGAIGASQVSADFSANQKGRAAAARILSVTEGPEDEPESTKSTLTTLSSIYGSVEFAKGQFAYPTRPDNFIFYPSPSNDNLGLNLSVGAQESLGLVGKSGSGKSTVLQMVLRFYDLTSGTCLLDGSHDLQKLDIEWLRRQIGYVGQQPTLFTGTVKENIMLGKPDASQEEMIAAAKAANAHDFIVSLSDGYETDIGTAGGQLSGGQKQRIAIARAIIRNPTILVLDEATAALDNQSEEKVQAALDSLQETQPRTTLVVAHRLLTVKKCTKIAFLGDGGVIEIGSFSDLLEKKGQFYKLWKMQGAEEELKKDR